MDNRTSESKYLGLLPGIFQTTLAGVTEPDGFLGRFLKAFEKILDGIDDDLYVNGEPLWGFSQVLDRIDTLFDPLETRADFLSWLAGWVALTLIEGEDWDEGRQRRFIQAIVPLYRLRGTPEGLAAYLRAFLAEEWGVRVAVSEFLQPFQVGKTSLVGRNTVVGEGRPFYFQVYLRMGAGGWRGLEHKIRAVLDLVNREKPAYTYFLLIVETPGMQIGVRSCLGEDTMIGGAEVVAQPGGRWVRQR